LYLVVFLLPLQTRWMIRPMEVAGFDYAYGTISLYALDIILLLALALFAWERKKELVAHPERISISGFWLILAGLELIVFISILVSADVPAAIYGYVNFLFGVGLLWMIVYAAYSRAKLFIAFLAGAVLQAGVGVWQFLAQSDIACKWLGMARHQAGELGTSVVETLAGGRWLRAYGTMDHPNILGGYLAVSILVAVYWLVKRSAKEQSRDRRRLDLYLGFLAVFLFIGLFFTFSRTAWAGLLVGLVAFGAVALYLRHRRAQKRLLLMVAAFLAVGALLFASYSNLVLSRLSQDTYTEIKSATERMSAYQVAGGVIRDNLFLGTGVRNYGPVVEDSLGREGKYYMYQPVHNVFLLVMAEIGLAGLIFFVAVLQYVFTSLVNAGKTAKPARPKQEAAGTDPAPPQEKSDNKLFALKAHERSQKKAGPSDPYAWYKLAFLVALITMFMADHWWWSLHFGMLLFWLVIGIMLRQENATPGPTST